MNEEFLNTEIKKVITIKNNAYQERNKILCALAWLIHNKGCKFPCQVYLARHPDSDESWENDWRNIIVIQPYGDQMAWHIHDNELPLFFGLPKKDDYVWDGHTTENKYTLLFHYFCEQW